MPTNKIDFKKTLKHLYNPSKVEFSIVTVPEMAYLMIDGHGDPNTTPAYQAAVEALYALSYALKFTTKREQKVDYVVLPLEGLWWVENMADFSLENKDQWDWTMMIMQPEWVTAEMVERVRKEVAKKKNPSALPQIRFEPYDEGLAIQIQYIGAYDDEAPVIARMHQFIDDEGYVTNGKHHEIYLSDPRRTAPERLRTVLRQPMRKV